MGPSEAPTKTVTVITEYTCPIVVSKDNWLGGATHSDTFSVQQRETDIVVTRTDSTDGWGMDLEFQCCNGKVSYIKHSNTFVLKFLLATIKDHIYSMEVAIISLTLLFPCLSE